MANWLSELSIGEWTLIATVVVLVVTTIGVFATIRVSWRNRAEAKRPVFSVETRPAPPSDNPTLFIACSKGALEYDLVAEILALDDDEGLPAAIALLGTDAVLVDQNPPPDVYKRYDLGRIKMGDTRAYSVQPGPWDNGTARSSMGSADSHSGR